MRKRDEKEISRILNRNRAPDIKEEKTAQLKRELHARMESMDILTRISFPDRLLRQIPYIAPWVWALQACFVLLFAVASGLDGDRMETFMLLSCAGPLLALLPAVDIARSFGCNMWEMEAACRYDLRRITGMRLCIVGGADVAVLAFGGILYVKEQGSLWKFGFFVLLPFLLSSCVYLWELNHFSRKCSGFLLCATGVGLNAIGCPLLQDVFYWMMTEYRWSASGFTGMLLLFAAVLTVYGSIRFYGNLTERGEIGRWNLE